MTDVFWSLLMFGLGAIVVRLLWLSQREKVQFGTDDDGVHWTYNGEPLRASPGTDKLQDAFDFFCVGGERRQSALAWEIEVTECTRKARHGGPCNGYPANTCSEESKAGYRATLR